MRRFKIRSKNLFPGFIFVIIFGIGLVWARGVYNPLNIVESAIIAMFALVLALFIPSAIRIADPWSKAVVLRLGKFQSLRRPGLFFIVPVIDTIPYWIDTRVITTSFKAEKTNTRLKFS